MNAYQYPAAPPTYAGTPTDPTAVMGRRTVAWIIDFLLWLVLAAFLGPTPLSPLAEYVDTEGVVGIDCDDIQDASDVASCVEIGDRLYFVEGNDATISLVVLWILAPLAYVAVLGATGRTPGMVPLGVKVVNEQGDTPGFGKSFIRTVLWIVDGIPYFIPLVGFITGLTTAGHRRVGDMAAKTFVVGRAHSGPVVVPGLTPPGGGGYVPYGAPGQQQAWDAPAPAGPGGPPGPGGRPPAGQPPAWGAPAPAPPGAQPGSWGAPSGGFPVPGAASAPDSPPPGAAPAPGQPGSTAAAAGWAPPGVQQPSGETPPAAGSPGSPTSAAAPTSDAPGTAGDTGPVPASAPAETPSGPSGAYGPSGSSAPTEPPGSTPGGSGGGPAPSGESPAVDTAPTSPASSGPATPGAAAAAAAGAAGAPSPGEPSAPAATPQSAPSGYNPQWDAARGTYIVWEPNRGKWLGWDESSQEWKPL